MSARLAPPLPSIATTTFSSSAATLPSAAAIVVRVVTLFVPTATSSTEARAGPSPIRSSERYSIVVFAAT